MPKLELIHRKPAGTPNGPPILLVHGGWGGAWCWEYGFIDKLTGLGWEVYALSLRGHGKSEGRDKLRWASIKNYVDDVRSVADSLPTPPLIVGHSMGAFVLQRYLTKGHPAAAVVLLSSVPAAGIRGFTKRLIRRHPVLWLRCNLTLSLMPIIEKPEHFREWVLGPETTEERVLELHSHVQDESYRAVVDMTFALPPRRKNIPAIPMTVIAGENDAIVTVKEARRTARRFGVTADVVPGMPHGLFEPQWRDEVAERVDKFARSLT
ncbi:alpha/beta hydrolase [Rhodococcus sp. W8901]|uniref:alpha/beta hydrolase n=1 Tax=Rhodococcus sp. W8901 TaxID=2742603 RepID=UPI001581A6A8|nr:alpha/beta hydrolase [Rhodococcus sp. W8901]QKT13245.1 alpha/beta fold hydrolase [Rhodococcus sp. W8901]